MSLDISSLFSNISVTDVNNIRVNYLLQYAHNGLPINTSFTSNGGTLIFFVSGSWYSANAGQQSMQFTIVGNSTNTTFYHYFTFNSVILNAHIPFSTSFSLSHLQAGLYTFQVTSTASNNGYDYTNAVILELPI